MLTTIPGSTKISATTSHQEKCESSWEILLPAGWRRAVSSLKPVWALPDGQAVTASLPTWPRSQPSTAAAWALHTLAARALAVPAERACVCPHTQSQPKEHLGPMQNSHASVIFSHLRCKTELPCVKHVTSNPCWQIVSLQGNTWTALAMQLSHTVLPSQQRILDIKTKRIKQISVTMQMLSS